MKIKNQKSKIKNNDYGKSSGFTPTPQRGVVPRVLSILRSVRKLFAGYRDFLVISWRHKNATPRLVWGFTLVESLVAITIVIISVVGPLTIVSKTLSFSRFARDEITAFYLTQDAAEFVRNARDNNLIAGDDWLSGLSACVGGACIVDSVANDILSCGASCDPLKLSSSGSYGYSGGESTHFTREVVITETVENREATILVTVHWNEGLFERDFSMREYIYNWQ